MDPVAQFEDFRGRLIGRRVTFVRLAINSLLLYVDCEPGDGRGLTFWLEAPWHVSTPERVVVGSRQAEGAGDDEPTSEELDAVGDLICDALFDRPIRMIHVEERSHDLELTVEGGNRVRTFVSDPDSDHVWHIRDNATGLKVMASPSSLHIHRGRA